jgi:hypothetical protein
LYPPPVSEVIRDLRYENSDAWVEQQPGSIYADLENVRQRGWIWISDTEFWSEESDEEVE